MPCGEVTPQRVTSHPGTSHPVRHARACEDVTRAHCALDLRFARSRATMSMVFGVVFAKKSVVVSSESFTRVDATSWTLDLGANLGGEGYIGCKDVCLFMPSTGRTCVMRLRRA